MATAVAQPELRVVQRQTRFSVFAQLPQIEPQHLLGLSRIELFSVISEHWLKCSAPARIYMLSSEDRFIRGQARAQNKALGVTQICADQVPGVIYEQVNQTPYLTGV
ncbi:hypothetical protein FA341_32065 [Pseudomonas aeruginosa]|jgi:hypothetical protein|uniref:ParC protein n=1 Tax=Pseudomonas aeruginosa TaxID=287 RepID=A0A6B1YMA4_PSEAI|nr:MULTISPECIES: hypothetical protein [Pseudomonas aeruginosa group]EIU2643068.1 hypothetical protein [Pseudomonas aeruginosa]EIU9544630.1 hypothetical protein [Pseudomonas aeruginosa]EIU9551389.1 hypothetical protein [Pseudomonas aeruginosa]EJY6032481.1 hypothetical protein [Pseudomonas aeruginosa]EKC7897408.1 hypothetical protein [Pseudomonas aeruginosa]